MNAASTTIGGQKSAAEDLSSLREVRRAKEPSARSGHEKRSFYEPVKDAIDKASNIKHLHEESLKRAEERDLERKLALQLIDIGYKALASKLHPDRGGSAEAMQQLNRVRDQLK
jgi:hypothetical protein